MPPQPVSSSVHDLVAQDTTMQLTDLDSTPIPQYVTKTSLRSTRPPPSTAVKSMPYDYRRSDSNILHETYSGVTTLPRNTMPLQPRGLDTSLTAILTSSLDNSRLHHRAGTSNASMQLVDLSLRDAVSSLPQREASNLSSLQSMLSCIREST